MYTFKLFIVHTVQVNRYDFFESLLNRSQILLEALAVLNDAVMRQSHRTAFSSDKNGARMPKQSTIDGNRETHRNLAAQVEKNDQPKRSDASRAELLQHVDTAPRRGRGSGAWQWVFAFAAIAATAIFLGKGQRRK